MKTSEQGPATGTARIFDGYHVVPATPGGDATEGTYTPTLVDGGVSLMGYRESPMDAVTSATDAIVENSIRHGVGVMLDDGSSFEALYRARHTGVGSTIIGGGPILTDLHPRTEAERQVSNASDLRRSIGSLQAEESTWLNLRTNDIDFLSTATAAAREAGLKVSLRTSKISALDAAHHQAGMLIGAYHLNGMPPAGGARGILEQWAATDPAANDRSCRLIAASGMIVTSGLLTIRRSALPKEALGSPFLEELLPILPHVRYLIEMRRAGGYMAGRRQLAKHTGFQEPTASQKQLALRGWEMLTAATRTFVQHDGQLLPASHGPGLGIVPGHGIKEELTLLAHIYADPVLALRQGTGLARTYLGVPQWSQDKRTGDSDSLYTSMEITHPDVILDLGRKPKPGRY